MSLADNKDTAGSVSIAIAHRFDCLPLDIRKEVLLNLADNKDAAGDVADAVRQEFWRLPENVRNELQKRLARHGYNIG